MIILGISNGETSSACLISDSIVLAAASEERFSRIKMDDSWPTQSIDYVLKSQNITLKEVDYVSYGWYNGFNAEKHLLTYFDRIVYEVQNNYKHIDILRERIETELGRGTLKREEFDNFITKYNLQHKVVTFNHHECHAISAFSSSPFDSSLVITSDGRGDFDSMTVSHFKDGKYKVLYRAPSNDSLGFFYGRITSLLGYKPHRHEGKITGLAAYGDSQKYIDLMQKMIYVENGKVIANNGLWYRPFYSNFSSELEQIISEAKPEDIAAAAQRHLENILIEIASYYMKQTKEKYICVAGGVFANVMVNQKLLEIDGIDNIFVQPHMGDGGLALGSAVGVIYSKFGKKVKLPSMYLGPEYNMDELLQALKLNKNLNIEVIDNIPEKTVELLQENKVIGLFQGRMEFGPRALCNRSVIYHCNDKSVNRWLNERFNRTEFMPFAPVTAEELAEKCYKNWRKEHIASKYMTLTYNCFNEMVDNCPAAVHIDKTARPQIINSDDNLLMHSILLKWYDKTGGLSLINTSFNAHEEPIVCSPDDAVNSLINDTIDVLVFDKFIVTKSGI